MEINYHLISANSFSEMVVIVRRDAARWFTCKCRERGRRGGGWCSLSLGGGLVGDGGRLEKEKAFKSYIKFY